MKKILLSIALLTTNFIALNAQELKGELINKAGQKIEKCDCENFGDNESVAVRTYLTENMFKYDKIVFKYSRIIENGETSVIYDNYILGQTLRAEYQSKGYIDEVIVSKDAGKFSKFSPSICEKPKDFDFFVSVIGYFITGYEEKLEGNTITKTPIYGSGTLFGATNVLPVIINKELSKIAEDRQEKGRKKFRRKAIIYGAVVLTGGVVGGVLFLSKFKK